MIFPVFKVSDIRKLLVELFQKKLFVNDRTGAQVVELIGASFIADEESIIGTPSSDWNERELQWYLSESLNVNDIPPPIPKIWQSVADPDGFINSNYGWMVFSEANGLQYLHALLALQKNPNTRQALMVYNRPTIHSEWNENGKLDFICCLASHFFIRNDTLVNCVYWRSQDAVFGYKGDFFWHKFVYDKLFDDLIKFYPNLQKTHMLWKCSSLHVYSRHFNLLGKELEQSVEV